MKAIIIVPGLSKYLPYISIYEKIFSENKVDYKILQWDRLSLTTEENPEVFKNGYGYSDNPLKRLWSYHYYLKWIKRKIRAEAPDIIIIATLAPAVFLNRFLNSWRGRYILDIRDYSPIVKFLKPVVKKVIENSGMSLISSKGFLSWLPKHKYYPIYNFGIDSEIEFKCIDTNNIHVATIGFIRDYEENVRIIDAIGNKKGVRMSFHGNGIALNSLIDYTDKKKYKNIVFTGPYTKDIEPDLYADADIINILMPSGKEGSTLLSNRFMNAATFRRPMILTSGSYQSELAKQYQIGLSINYDSDILVEIREYIKNFNYTLFCENCKRFVEEAKQEHNDTIDKLRLILSESNCNENKIV